jgi:uncharacterized integral membrane protein
MRAITWIKTFIVILTVIFLAIFFTQNRGPAIIQFPFTRPRHFGLIYLLLISFALGVVASLSVAFTVRAKIKKKKMSDESEELFEEE